MRGTTCVFTRKTGNNMRQSGRCFIGHFARGLVAVFVAGNVVACADHLSAPVVKTVTPRESVGLEADSPPQTIVNRYIVVLEDHVPSAAQASATLVAQVGGQRFYVWETALKGFAVVNLPAGAADALRRNPLVKLVEESKLMRPLGGTQRIRYPADTGLFMLDRIDQRNLPLDAQFGYTSTGLGVHIYIIDSGIRGGHQEWGYGRIGESAAFIKWSVDPSPTIDSQGHGTGVAGAAAGSMVGVAKQSTLHSVRIDDGEPDAYTDDIIAGLNWVAEHRQLPAVANLSYEANSQAMSYAAAGVISHGVVFVTAANQGYSVNACHWTTEVVGVITVGATQDKDFRSTYSSFGPCIDFFAPGGDAPGYSYPMKLASNVSNTSYRYWWGTSFAAPLAAGVAALRLSENPSISPVEMEVLLNQQATPNVVVNAGTGSPNRLLYSAPPPPPGPSFPVSIAGPATIQPGATCTWYSVVSGGTAPYTYQWTNDDLAAGNSYYYTGSKAIGSGGTSFRLKVVVTDAVNGLGESEITVFENPSAGVCQQ
jgi:subtilisin family serine protease